jgi:hypothetical protein
MIAFDPNTWLMYEGLSNYGHGVWPAPMVSVATFVQGEQDWRQVPATGELRGAKHVFREDFFDPVSRIRRGRFYELVPGRQQPDQWWVHKHPVVPEEIGHRSSDGRICKQLITFYPMSQVGQRLLTSPKTLVVLGASDAVTAWNIVSVEKAGNNEDVVTLRARSNLGFLPDLILDAVPESARERVSAAVTKVVDGAHRSSGITVVDLCRDALVVILSAHLEHDMGSASKINEKDLAELIGALPEDKRLFKSTADVVCKLHPRGKSNEQYKRCTRDVTDTDGMLAIEALGFVLRDLGWAR